MSVKYETIEVGMEGGLEWEVSCSDDDSCWLLYSHKLEILGIPGKYVYLKYRKYFNFPRYLTHQSKWHMWNLSFLNTNMSKWFCFNILILILLNYNFCQPHQKINLNWTQIFEKEKHLTKRMEHVYHIWLNICVIAYN